MLLALQLWAAPHTVTVQLGLLQPQIATADASAMGSPTCTTTVTACKPRNCAHTALTYAADDADGGYVGVLPPKYADHVAGSTTAQLDRWRGYV